MRAVALAAVLVVAVLAGGVWLVLQPAREAVREAPHPQHPTIDARAAGAGERTRQRVHAAPRRSSPRTGPVEENDPLDAIRALIEAGRNLDALEAVVDLRQERPALFARGVHDDWIAEIERAAAAEVGSSLAALTPAEARALVERVLGLVSDRGAERDLRRLAMQLAGDVAGREKVVLAGAQRPTDKAALASHLAHFGPVLPGTDRTAGATGTLSRRLLRVRDRASTRKRVVVPLQIADHEESELRRLDQLEKLRERDAVGLLEHIHLGLVWLALHQGEDGSFTDAATEKRCAELGNHESCVDASSKGRYELASTALGALAFLDFRDQDARAVFEPTLSAAISWLRGQIRENGAFPKHSYEAGIALMALGQAASSSGDPEIYADLERAWAYYAGNAQLGPAIGYRYGPGQLGDLSVTGWYVQAFEAAVDAEAKLPAGLGEGLEQFVRSSWNGQHDFMYVPGQQATRATLRSLGMLSLEILDPNTAEPMHEDWTALLAQPPRSKRLNLYTLYYDVRMELALRGDLNADRRRMLDEFAALYQTAEGEAMGRFAASPDKTRLKSSMKKRIKPSISGSDAWIRRGGTTVFTAFSLLTLEHALYRR